MFGTFITRIGLRGIVYDKYLGTQTTILQALMGLVTTLALQVWGATVSGAYRFRLWAFRLKVHRLGLRASGLGF